ncbi:MAG: hypothetical protein LBS40_05465 [Burkholderiales bacterium]|nr:hypothetical protein [Burkholderiales bacterium]
MINAAKKANMDLSGGYMHAADVYGIRHIKESHGNAKKEISRGQLPVTDEDIQRIPEIVDSPDKIAIGAKSRIGREMVVYLKKMNDGTTLYMEEQRTGKKQLALQSMRKYPATMNDASKILKTVHLYARNDSGDGLIIVDMDKKVNSMDKKVKPLTKSFTPETGIEVYRITP